MKITILTVGSRGDIQPFIALAIALKTAGYQVTVATHDNFAFDVSQHQLDFIALGSDVQALMSSEKGKKFAQESSNPFKMIKAYGEMLQPFLIEAMETSFQACQGSELIIANIATTFWADQIAQQLHIPLLAGVLQPISPTGDFPCIFLPPKLNLGRWLNYLTHHIFRIILWQIYHPSYNQWRKQKFNLSLLKFWQDTWSNMEKRNIPYIYAYSSHIVPKPSDWKDNCHITGYWFLESESNYQPPAEVVDFLADGKPPVYIGFGSMTGEKPEQMTDIALKALKKSGQRGILSTGWGGISNVDLPDNILKIESIPHDWLFPQMCAIVHHGGAGTTSAALKAGIPSVIIPFIADQIFWGYQTAKLGIASPPIPKHQLTIEKLSQAISLVITDEKIRQKAQELGVKIRSENGQQQVINLLKSYI
jgi:UDP:flavonoid glycosyltransferase YjiC (YdhE family)